MNFAAFWLAGSTEYQRKIDRDQLWKSVKKSAKSKISR